MNISVPLGTCCQAEEILIARVIEHTVRFPSLVRAEAPLCKGNLCQGQVGTERENLKKKKKQKKLSTNFINHILSFHRCDS